MTRKNMAWWNELTDAAKLVAGEFTKEFEQAKARAAEKPPTCIGCTAKERELSTLREQARLMSQQLHVAHGAYQSLHQVFYGGS